MTTHFILNTKISGEIHTTITMQPHNSASPTKVQHFTTYGIPINNYHHIRSKKTTKNIHFFSLMHFLVQIILSYAVKFVYLQSKNEIQERTISSIQK